MKRPPGQLKTVRHKATGKRFHKLSKGRLRASRYLQYNQGSVLVNRVLARIHNLKRWKAHRGFCIWRLTVFSAPLPTSPAACWRILCFAADWRLRVANLFITGDRADKSEGEDGILTALEASSLNLIGTELVMPSSCEAGVGEIKNSEGVYGLRRAFQHAGARTIIMSLWKVQDKETRELMETFYNNWMSGDTKKEALRKAALRILNDHRAKGESTHPLLWGGFVLLGDPN